MVFEWIRTADRKPIPGRVVLTLNVYKFTDCDWQWCAPVLASYYGGNQYSWLSSSGHAITEPEMWAYISMPELPDCEERRKARAIGLHNEEIERQIEALKKQRK